MKSEFQISPQCAVGDGRSGGFLGRIHFLQLVAKISDLTLENFYVFFRFVIELFTSRRQLWKK